MADLLTSDFRAIKKQLEIVVETTKSTEDYAASPKHDIHTLEKIKLAKAAYSLLYEMSVKLNYVFSLSQLINLTQGFIYLTSDLHSLYVKLYLNDFAALLGLQILLFQIKPELQIHFSLRNHFKSNTHIRWTGAGYVFM